jgi:EAL domain-containing protein (putative c-di-GMP-specific phosphodiesterase class I)
VAVSNLDSAINFIRTLKEFGFRFALDDFGSGISSFGYLKNLPLDYLKIDGMFVKNIVEDPIDYAIVKSINEMGHLMGMQTIAKYVENDEVKVMLTAIGIDYGQGYGLGKPKPLKYLIAQRTA